MVYCVSVPHTIYGVIPMTNEFSTVRRNPTWEHANILNFLLFFTGAVLGCLLVRFFGIKSILHPEDSWDISAVTAPSFYAVLLANGKFLILLYLLAFLRCGAALVPPLFGAEGAFLGAAFASVVSAMGYHGAVLLTILLVFRLVLVLTYGFLLGSWSVKHSLSFGAVSDAQRQNRILILLFTLAVLVIASFLECTLVRWLGGIYYLKFGV